MAFLRSVESRTADFIAFSGIRPPSDEGGAGSNPATPTIKGLVEGRSTDEAMQEQFQISMLPVRSEFSRVLRALEWRVNGVDGPHVGRRADGISRLSAEM